jgi:FAD/FMN-containing dehydrogenase
MRRFSQLRIALAALLLAIALVLSGRKVSELSADPLGEKDCPPLIPGAIGDASKSQLVQAAAMQDALPWRQQGGTINDASCLNRTAIYGIVQVRQVEDVQNAVQFAAANGLKVSIAGVRHSMGGQAFAAQALVLDMTRFNQMTLDEANRVLTVQSGATWHDIQNFLHPRFAVKAMQSTDIFTVGGSIAVNAHGMDHQVGALGKTIRSLRVLLADGSIQTVSRSENPELFHLIVGGYGLFGVVLEAELEITENVIYTPGRQVIDYQAFPTLFEQQLAQDTKLGLFYGHLSTAPQSFLQEMILYTYTETEVPDATIPPLGEVSSVKLRRFVLNFSKLGDLPMRIKWFAEKHIEPHLESCTVTRAQAQGDGEACLVSRNEPMHDSVHYLKNNLPKETDILQEYFIPRGQFVVFIDGLRTLLGQHEANLLNASVRVVHPEDNMLNYAPEAMFAVVLYLNQPTTAAGNESMRSLTSDLIDLAIAQGGTFFLPYQLHYSPEQLRASYPMIDEFFAAKRQYDPQELFTNSFYEKYGRE